MARITLRTAKIILQQFGIELTRYDSYNYEVQFHNRGATHQDERSLEDAFDKGVVMFARQYGYSLDRVRRLVDIMIGKLKAEEKKGRGIKKKHPLVAMSRKDKAAAMRGYRQSLRASGKRVIGRPEEEENHAKRIRKHRSKRSALVS